MKKNKTCDGLKDIFKALQIKFDEATYSYWIKIDPSADPKLNKNWAMLTVGADEKLRKYVCGCKSHEKANR